MSQPDVHVGASRVAQNTVLSMVAVLALGGSRLIFNLLVGHRLGKEALGHVNSELAAATFASLAFAAGSAIAATKFVAARLGAGDAAGARRALVVLSRWCVLGTLIVMAVLAATLPLLLPELSWADVAWTCLLLCAYSAYTFVRGAQYAYGAVRRYAVLELVADSLSVAGAFAVVLLGAEALLLLPFVVGYAVFAVFGWFALPARPRAADSLPAAMRREMRGYLFWTALGVVGSTGFLQLSMVFAQYYGTAAQAGLYASAFTLVVPAYFLPRALSMALFPSMASAFGRGDEEEISRQLDVGTRILIIGMLPLFVGAVLLARPLLTLFFNDSYAAAYLVLGLLLTATYASIVAIPAVNSLVATARNLIRLPVYSTLAGCGLGVAVWLAFGGRYATTAVALGYLAGSVLQGAVPILSAWRRWGQSWGLLLLRTAGLVAVAGAMWALTNELHGALLPSLGLSLAFTGLTALVCPPEVRLIAGRLRVLARRGTSRRIAP